jgi:hypothetical protein
VSCRRIDPARVRITFRAKHETQSPPGAARLIDRQQPGRSPGRCCSLAGPAASLLLLLRYSGDSERKPPVGVAGYIQKAGPSWMRKPAIASDHVEERYGVSRPLGCVTLLDLSESGSATPAGAAAALVLAIQEFVANGGGRPSRRRRRSAASRGRMSSRGCAGRRGCSAFDYRTRRAVGHGAAGFSF